MSDLHERLASATGKTTYRKLGELTDTHPETVRRYMQGQSPSASFLAHVCTAFGICGEWLLTGKGPMRVQEVRGHALKQADASELLGAIANTLNDLGERMDRMERYVQGLETRLRASGRKIEPDERSATQSHSARSGPTGTERAAGASPAGTETAMLEPERAIGRIRDAVAKRASEHADRVAQAERA
ncbi:MAG: hypothetical protein AAGA55_03180 [Planctomycetota bacterium]